MLYHRRGDTIPGAIRAANRAASSKQPRFIRRWRRFGCFHFAQRVFCHAHVAAENGFHFFRVSERETLRGFFDRLKFYVLYL